ncbi:PH domain-containing protein [Scrofimicrobium sp. R131]|uniref:PH domain-containing protein n=1 Tax=Scrofimicrobium appendicitidis TaxID=3079930 RepID=A0AAU7VAD2_9ACTO
MNYRLSFRARGAVAAFLFTVAGAIAFVLVVLFADGLSELSRALPLALVVGFWAWWRWEWPRLIATEDGILIRNQLRTIAVPWEEIDGFTSRLGLYAEVRGLGEKSRQIYVASVPSRASFNLDKELKESPPALQFPKGPQLDLWVGPNVARRMLEEERLYHQKPVFRPDLSQVAEEQLRQHPVGDLRPLVIWPETTVSWNWVPIGLQALTLVGAIATLLTF